MFKTAFLFSLSPRTQLESNLSQKLRLNIKVRWKRESINFIWNAKVILKKKKPGSMLNQEMILNCVFNPNLEMFNSGELQSPIIGQFSFNSKVIFFIRFPASGRSHVGNLHRRYRLGRLLARLSRGRPNVNRILTGRYRHVPACVQLPLASQAHGIHSVQYLEAAADPCKDVGANTRARFPAASLSNPWRWDGTLRAAGPVLHQLWGERFYWGDPWLCWSQKAAFWIELWTAGTVIIDTQLKSFR